MRLKHIRLHAKLMRPTLKLRSQDAALNRIQVPGLDLQRKLQLDQRTRSPDFMNIIRRSLIFHALQLSKVSWTKAVHVNNVNNFFRKGKTMKRVLTAIVLVAIAAGCSKPRDPRRDAMLHAFAQADADFIDGIAAANSNELFDLSNNTVHYSNIVMSTSLSLTNYADASNELDRAIDLNDQLAFMNAVFYEQAARAKRSSVTNKMLLAKLSWFFTNEMPEADPVISNDLPHEAGELARNLYLARHSDVELAGINELRQLVQDISNSMPVQSPPPRQQYYYRPATVATGPRQIPPSVLAQIRADAEREWPGNFDMQEFRIKQQTEAWHRLNP